MAKNYTMSEAVKVLAEGTDTEAMYEIGRRFPLLAHKVTVVATKAGAEFVELMAMMPENLTATKVNNVIKGSSPEPTDADGDECAENASETETEKASGDFESMSANELWEILKGYGIKKKAGYVKKSVLIAMVEEAIAGGTKAEEAEAEEESQEEVEAGGYAAMSAVELFKECKARGIKAAPKKPSKVYIELLEEDDNANSSADDDDDWDAEPEAPAAKPAKAAKKAKPAPEPEPADDDDDDDWDI